MMQTAVSAAALMKTAVLTKIVALMQQAAPSSMMQMLGSLLPFLLIFVIFYFLLIAPARKRQKALQEMIENLNRGDKVITSGGIHGEVSSITGPIAILKVADNVKIKVSKSAIAGLETSPEKEGKDS